MGTIYHLTPAAYFEKLDSEADYLPAPFDQDGFIHCSADEEQMLEVANRYYQGEPGEFLLLIIDEDAVRAEVRHENSVHEPNGSLYPHIYGPLNRDAIREVRPFSRTPDGTFHW